MIFRKTEGYIYDSHSKPSVLQQIHLHLSPAFIPLSFGIYSISLFPHTFFKGKI